MTDRQPPSPGDGHDTRFGESVSRSAARKRRARREGRRTAWFGLGMFGLVGWSVTVPALLGIAAGIWLDRHWTGRISWTLTLLVVGVTVGCLNAWYWMKEESRRD